MQNFIAQSMRRMGLATDNKVTPVSPNTGDQKAANSQAPLSHMTIGSKWSYSTLEYPMDIQTRSDMGHYMMFYINIATDSGFGRTDSQSKKGTHGNQGLKAKRSMKDPAQAAVMSGGGFSEKQTGSAPDSTGSSWKPGSKPKVIERESHQGTASNATGIKRTHRTNDSIVLYMPAQISTNYTADYKETELGANFGEAAGRISKSDMSTLGGVGELVKGLSGMAAHQTERAAGALVGTAIGGDINAARDKLSNRAQNNFLEACFTGLQFRKFSFQWKFTPKSPEEAKQVMKIIKTFKFHMLPEMKGGEHGRWFGNPAEFDLFYMFRGDENEWINKIQTCVLRNMDVNYAPNGYQTFRPIEGVQGAPPTEIDMKLDFQETKLITKEDALKGF
jgi:hypothetical protein